MSTHLIIDRQSPYRRAALLENEAITQFYATSLKDSLPVGSIIQGKILKYEKSIQRYFVQIGAVQKAILKAQHGPYHEGQWVNVQVTHTGNAQEEKGSRVTDDLKFDTQWCVLKPYQKGLTMQGTQPKTFFQSLEKAFAGHVQDCAVLIKKNAKDISVEALLSQYLEAKQKLSSLLSHGNPSVQTLWQPFADWIIAAKQADQMTMNTTEDYLLLLEAGVSKEKMHVTHQTALFEEHNIEEIWESLFDVTVSLASGGDLVFEKTKALITIDVNTSGATGATRKSLRQFHLDLVPTLVRQIKWRNLSGIIIVDFAGFVKDDRAFQKEMLECIRACAAGDKLQIVGFTKLGLLELTRPSHAPALADIVQGDVTI